MSFHGDIDSKYPASGVCNTSQVEKFLNRKKYAACQKLISYWLSPIGLIARSVRHNFTSCRCVPTHPYTLNYEAVAATAAAVATTIT